MSGSSETAGSERPCGLTSFLPLGMSCRGRAEAFARSLQSRLRTLGTQGTSLETNNLEQTEHCWLAQNAEQPEVTITQPLRNHTHESADSFFDFDIDNDNESPGSPAEECEYSRLIETTSNTPHDAAPESGYVCASPISPENSCASQSSSDGPYFDPESSDNDQKSVTGDFFDCVDANRKDNTSSISSNSQSTLANGCLQNTLDSDSCSESLPPSQSTDTCTAHSSASNSTLQDVPASELESPPAVTEQLIVLPVYVNSTSCMDEQIILDERDKETESLADKECLEKRELPNGHIPYVPLTNEEIHLIENLDVNTESVESEQNELTNNATDHELLKVHIDATLHVPDNACDNQSTSADEDDVEHNRPQRVRRCSSLKTGKTPPGTPGRKKIVRFADVLGLDLADVRTFLDDIPKIPKSAFDDLEVDNSEPGSISLGPRMDKILMPLFQQPAGLPNFLDIVRNKQVCLENAAVTDPITLTITGSVRVRNLDFHKSVYIRYSLDQWQSFADLQANYVENSCDGFSDKFTFTVFGNSLQVGQRIEMAARFHCKGQQYWDNNYGQNYVFQCLPTASNQPVALVSSVRATTVVDDWCPNFY